LLRDGSKEKSITPTPEECLEDPVLFFPTYLPSLIPSIFPAQEEWIDGYLLHKFFHLQTPVDSGKSTTFSIGIPIWEICNNRDIRIGLFSRSDSKPKMWLSKIKAHLRQNQDLIRDFGRFYSPSLLWTDSEIVVVRDRESVGDFVEPTMAAFGKGSDTIGYHFDIIICDDLIAIRDTLSLKTMETDQRWFDEELMGAMEARSKMIVIGHVQADGDLYETLERDKSWFFKRYECWMPDGSPLNPAQWDLESIAERQESMGESAFNRKMRNIRPRPLGSELRREWIDAMEGVDIGPDSIGLGHVYGGCDPAFGTSRNSSDFALLVGVFFPEVLELVILDIMTGKFSPKQRIESFKNMNSRWCPDIFRLETNAQQQELYETLKKEEDVILPLEAHVTGRNKASLTEGIPRLAAFLERGRIKYRKGCPSIDRLKLELKRYPNFKDDLVMALWMLLMAGVSRADRVKHTNEVNKTNFTKKRSNYQERMDYFRKALERAG
jgi:hypothetical protein